MGLSPTGDYRVVIAEWVIPPDAIALEHVQPETGRLCLVVSTTLPMRLNYLGDAAAYHEATCPDSRTRREATTTYSAERPDLALGVNTTGVADVR